MRSRTISALIAIVVLASLASPIAAANNPTASDAGPFDDVEVPGVDVNVGGDETPTATPTASDDNNTVPADSERIEPGLVLLSATHDPDTGTASLRFAVASSRAVTLTDAGGFLEGGEIDRRTEVLQEGRHTLRMPVTEVDGQVGVSVSTSDTLYAVPIDTGSPDLFEGDPTWQSVHLAGGAGLGGGLLIFGLIAWRRARGGREEVRRIA